MRREGSALHGLGVVTLKELADHFTSARVIVLQMLVVLIAVATIYVATEQIKDTRIELRVADGTASVVFRDVADPNAMQKAVEAAIAAARET